MPDFIEKAVYDPRRGLYREIQAQLQMFDSMKKPLKASELLSTISTEKLICLLRLSKKQLETELTNQSEQKGD